MASPMIQVPGGSPGMQYRAPQSRYSRSSFDRSNNHKTTFDASYLIPYYLDFVYPGDTHTIKLHAFCRIFSALKAPIMDNIELSIDFFYVPCRIIWENWDKFLGASDTAGEQTTDYTIPVLGGGVTSSVGSVMNYMGVPLGLQTSNVEVQCLPFRAMTAVYNEWYRDENLIDKVALDIGDDGSGAGAGTYATPLKSAKKPDYFTTALPYLQKGDAVSLPLTGLATVIPNSSNPEPTFVGAATGGPGSLFHSNTVGVDVSGSGWSDSEAMEWDTPNLYADLATVTSAVTINALREATAIQRMLEKDARGGTRITEKIRTHFGVDVPDMRVQRPEYLGGSRGYINVSPVANTANDPDTGQGELAGIGTGQLRCSIAKSFVEHGFVLGILRARGDINYQQGLDRMWSFSTQYDLMWPEFANLGEQAILNKEIFVSNNPAIDDLPFGYQERFAHERWRKSLVTGKFASDAAGSLDYWHLAEDFASLPGLNQTFIEDQTPMSRVTAVPAEPDFEIDGRFDVRTARVLPVRATPSLMPARF